MAEVIPQSVPQHSAHDLASEFSSLLPPDNQRLTGAAEDFEEREGCEGCLTWFTSGEPWKHKRLTFIIYLIFGLLSIVCAVAYFKNKQSINDDGDESDVNYGYVSLCIICIIMSLFSFFQLYLVIDSKRNLMQLLSETQEISKNRKIMGEKVLRLDETQRKLNVIEGSVIKSYDDLRSLYKDLYSLQDDKLSMLEKYFPKRELKNFQTEIRNFLEKYCEMLVNNEKKLVGAIYSRVEMMDHESGLSQHEFDELLNTLPKRYADKFDDNDIDFKLLSNGQPVIDEEAYKLFMEKLAEEMAVPEVPKTTDNNNNKKKKNKSDKKSKQKKKR